MKRIFALLLVIMLCSFAFVGCRQNAPVQPDESTDRNQVTDVTEKTLEGTDNTERTTDTDVDISVSEDATLDEDDEEAVASNFAFGTGTENDPYVIMTAAQLRYFADRVNAQNSFEEKYIKLGADIVLNNTSDWEVWGAVKEDESVTAPANVWTPIGTLVKVPYAVTSDEEFDAALKEFGVSEMYYYSSTSDDAYVTDHFTRASFYYLSTFSGTFDGDHHTIKGIYVNDEIEYRGLFGNAKNATVKNVGIEESYIGGYSYVGGVIGYGDACNVSGCYNTGAIEAGWIGGGIVGNLVGGTVQDCYNIGTLSAGLGGGIVGYNERGTVSLCHNSGFVSEKEVGGIVGENKSGIISYCYNTGDICGYNYVGGIVGVSSGTVFADIAVSCCYNTGSVKANKDNCGGIAGKASYGTFINCYNAGAVSGSNSVGGLVGRGDREMALTNCYACGDVSAESLYVDSVVGEISTDQIKYNTCCYFLSAYIPNARNKVGVALSDEEMKEAVSYVGFDFDNIWEIGVTDGYEYPTLKRFEN